MIIDLLPLFLKIDQANIITVSGIRFIVKIPVFTGDKDYEILYFHLLVTLYSVSV